MLQIAKLICLCQPIGCVHGKQCTIELAVSLRHQLHVFGFSRLFHLYIILLLVIRNVLSDSVPLTYAYWLRSTYSSEFLSIKQWHVPAFSQAPHRMISPSCKSNKPMRHLGAITTPVRSVSLRTSLSGKALSKL